MRKQSLMTKASPKIETPFARRLIVGVHTRLSIQANPNGQSTSQCWRLFALCVQFFPPNKDFCNHTHIFLRQNAPGPIKRRLVDQLYLSEYEGAKARPPGIDQIPSLTAGW